MSGRDGKKDLPVLPLDQSSQGGRREFFLLSIIVRRELTDETLILILTFVR